MIGLTSIVLSISVVSLIVPFPYSLPLTIGLVLLIIWFITKNERKSLKKAREIRIKYADDSESKLKELSAKSKLYKIRIISSMDSLLLISIILISFGVLSIGGVIISHLMESVAASFETYENTVYGVKMQYPSDWIKSQNNTSIRFIGFTAPGAPGETLQNVLIGVQDLSYLNLSFSLYEIKNEKIVSNTNMTDFQLLDSNINSTLAGKRAYNYTFTYLHANLGTLKVMEIGTIVDNKIYYIQYFATPSRYYELLPSVLRMIESFEIINV